MESMKKQKGSSQKGFTLIELLVTMAFFAIMVILFMIGWTLGSLIFK